MNTRSAYQVLARKYRPRTFADLIGQEALVKTLSNAIKNDRIAHAFLLTGIRGVGKTTTARIIARGLNCTGADGNGGPTTTPCGVCDSCKSILEDRHPDILEMDAASRTGVDDIREIIDNASYLPTSARYKIYIIDEVHMLSKNAFNALLKTLEEPPAHVKFIFATTEIRKIPVTILSRCQRFDLRRIEPAVLSAHLKNVASQESVTVEDDALALLISAAEGSVRDSLSLLDQAIAHSEGHVTSDIISKMLGTANRGRIVNLFSELSDGETVKALMLFKEQYDDGADPILILQDLLELCHVMTRLKVVSDERKQAALNGFEITPSILELVDKLDVAYLSRCWQMLLKGLEEAKIASHTLMAAEMILIRLAHMSTLPSPAELIRTAQQENNSGTPAPQPPQGGGSGSYSGGGYTSSQSSYSAPSTYSSSHSGGNPHSAPATHLEPTEASLPMAPNPQNFEEAVLLFQRFEEPLLYEQLRGAVALIRFEQGNIELAPTEFAGKDLAGKVSDYLTRWTGSRWMVTVSKRTDGALTIKEQENVTMLQEKEAMGRHPEIQPIMKQWPGAEIISINKNKKD